MMLRTIPVHPPIHLNESLALSLVVIKVYSKYTVSETKRPLYVEYT